MLSRTLRALLTIFLVVGFAFTILRLSGDPAMMILSADAPPEAIAAFRQSWGLDAPLWIMAGLTGPTTGGAQLDGKAMTVQVGTGCGKELAYWLGNAPWGSERKPEKKPTKPVKPPPPLTLAALPAECRAVVTAE